MNGLSRLNMVVMTGLSMLLLMCRSNPSSTLEARPQSIRVLSAAHAHNDYLHDQPLLDALDHGFRSVEVDVHLRNDTLFVAHDSVDIRSDRTIQSLYLDPLRERVRSFQARRSAAPADYDPLILLVDIKTASATTFAALNSTLGRYAEMLTVFGPDSLRLGFVSVIVSGNRDKQLIADARPRLAGIDGRPSDLRSDDGSVRFDSLAMPLISASWESLFDWRGDGPMPASEYGKLVAIAHDARWSGRELRFWATPDSPGPARTAVWDTLLSAGATLLNTDDLSGLADYLLDQQPR